jgi:hypothetical protein
VKDQSLKDLNDLYLKAKAARSKLEPIWYLNLAYYMGEQWIAWDGRGLFKPRLKANRITIVDNRIQPAVRLEIAKLTKAQPVFTVSPTTSDEEDEHAAEMGEQLMIYFWRHLNMNAMMMKGLLWSRICGAGFIKAFWDPTLGAGTDVVVGPAGQVLNDSTGRPMRAGRMPADALQALGASSRRVAQGDVRVEVRSPFQMFVDPLTDSFEDAEWVIEESVQSQETVKRRWGVELQPDTTGNPGLIESRMGAVFMPGSGSYKGVKVYEYWCRPNSDHPNGRRAAWAQKQMLEENDHPFDALPYVMLTGIQIPGRLWPTCIAEQLRGPQTELNKVKSQIAENRNRVGNPTILASKQAVQDPDRFTDSMTIPGGIYFFDDIGSPNTVPTYLQAPPLPEYVLQEIQNIEQSIQEIAGQHEVSSAQVPPGVTAASAINLLLESDDTRLGPAVTDYEVQLGQLGQKILKLAAHYYTDQRTIRIAGDSGVWQIFDFRGSMLRNNTHVEVQAGSAFPQSKAAKQAAMQDLLTFFVQSGNPPHGRQLAQFLKDWEVGGADRLIEDYTIDERQVDRENVRMMQNIPLPINDYDNDQAHIDGHQEFQKSDKYIQLPPSEQQIFTAHVAAHKQRMAQAQAAQMQMQQQAQGGGPQQPPGPQPPDPQAQLQSAAQMGMDMQGQAQQQGIQGAQAQLQTAIQGQQAHQQQLSVAQQQRMELELHQQKLRHAEELHQANLARQRGRAA